jgi:VanZ like family
LPVVLAAVASLPIAAVVVWGLAGPRLRQGMAAADAWRFSAAEVGMVAGTAPWIWMILTPLPGPALVYLVPFTDLWEQFHHPPLWFAFQITGNLLVFAAFGFLAPLRWRIGAWWVTGLAAAGSATVETLQWALHLGRVASVDDVLVNAAGAGVAALCSRRWWRVRKGPLLAPRG